MNEFHRGVQNALNDAQIRTNFRRAMDGLMAKRKAELSDPKALERLRHRCAEIRRDAFFRLPELLPELERNCTRNGIQVHWAGQRRICASTSSVLATVMAPSKT